MLKLHRIVRTYNGSPHALVALQDETGQVVQNEHVDVSALADDTQALTTIASLQTKADNALAAIALGQIQSRADDAALNADAEAHLKTLKGE